MSQRRIKKRAIITSMKHVLGKRTVCPVCGGGADSATHIAIDESAAVPTVGSIVVCAYCGAYNVLTTRGLKPASPEIKARAQRDRPLETGVFDQLARKRQQ